MSLGALIASTLSKALPWQAFRPTNHQFNDIFHDWSQLGYSDHIMIQSIRVLIKQHAQCSQLYHVCILLLPTLAILYIQSTMLLCCSLQQCVLF
jgi:hypothetical protein